MTFYERCAKAWDTDGDREFGIFDAVSDEMLGCVGINQINRINRFANMGYWVRASRERRGIASTAARLASGFAFAALGLARIEIVVLPDNMASRRVAEKIGARFECIARSRLQFGSEAHDAAMYSLVPGDPAARVDMPGRALCIPPPDGSTLVKPRRPPRPAGRSNVEPIAFLVLLPIVIGVVSELVFRDTTHATLAAAIGTAAALPSACGCWPLPSCGHGLPCCSCRRSRSRRRWPPCSWSTDARRRAAAEGGTTPDSVAARHRRGTDDERQATGQRKARPRGRRSAARARRARAGLSRTRAQDLSLDLRPLRAANSTARPSVSSPSIIATTTTTTIRRTAATGNSFASIATTTSINGSRSRRRESQRASRTRRRPRRPTSLSPGSMRC